MGRFIQLAMAGRRFCHAHGGAPNHALHRRATGVYIASGIGGFDVIEREHRSCSRAARAHLAVLHSGRHHQPGLGRGFHPLRRSGPQFGHGYGVFGSAHAVGDSFRLIERGDAEVMICGGTEAAITPMGIGGFAAMKALSTRNEEPARASRPFDAERDGFVVGEGSGILILSRSTTPRSAAPPSSPNRRLRHVRRRPPHHPAG